MDLLSSITSVPWYTVKLAPAERRTKKKKKKKKPLVGDISTKSSVDEGKPVGGKQKK
jgi:hypothetical protein